MNGFSNFASFLTFWCQNIGQFDWLNILYIQAKFVKERVKVNKFFPIIQNLGHFMVNLGGGSVLAW